VKGQPPVVVTDVEEVAFVMLVEHADVRPRADLD